MAKRLNKKVAVLGTVVLLMMFVVFFIVVQEKDIFTSQAKLLEDGDAAIAKQDYETAKKKYLRAKARAKTDEARIQAIHKLIDVYLDTEEWPPLRGVWQEMLRIEPGNLAVRYAQLKYYYIVANRGATRLWQDVESKASEFLEIVEREGILDADTSQWEKPQYEKLGLVHKPLAGSDGIQNIGQYLYLLKGRAKLEAVVSGATTEPDNVLEEAIQDLELAREIDPTNSNVVLQLVRAFIARGNLLASRGNFDEREKARHMALEIIEETIKNSPQDAHNYLNRLSIKRDIAWAGDVSEDIVAQFEKEYEELAERFPDNPVVFASVSSFYRGIGPKYLDKAIAAIERARSLESDNVMYSLSAASAYNLKAAITKDESFLEKTIAILNDSLQLPGVQETQGPQQWRHRRNKTLVYSYLAGVYLDRLLYPEDELSPEQRQESLTKAENIIHVIEQILGSGEDPVMMKWQGMLALAQGNRTEGIRKLYTVYERLKASNRMDTELAYVLAKTFEKTVEVGATHDFFAITLKLRKEDRGNRAGSIDASKPSALLEYARVLLRLGVGSTARNVVTYFENTYGATSRSRMIMANSLITMGDYEEAEAILAEGDVSETDRLRLELRLLQQKINAAQILIQRQAFADDANMFNDAIAEEGEEEDVDVKQLEKELKSNNDLLAENIEKLVTLEPNLVSNALVRSLCDRYRDLGQENKARELANLFLSVFPEDLVMRTYLRMLDSGGPMGGDEELEIRRQLIEEMSDPSKKALLLGMFNMGRNEPNEAIAQFEQVILIFEDKADSLDEGDQLSYRARIATEYLFDLAVQAEDMAMAEEITNIVGRHDFDQCNGDYFKAKLSAVQDDYESALKHIERCVEQRPLSSQILVLRGQIKESLGRTHEGITDMKQAAQFNPRNGNISKILALALFRRNERLGNNVTTDQFLEAKQAIERAVGTNGNDIQLLSFYAEFISDTEPRKALAIRQRLFKDTPTVQNAVLLGNMAFNLSEDQTDPDKKQALIQIASDSYEKALELEPANQIVLVEYAEFYRATGREDEAERLISGSQNENVQWRYYYRIGQYPKAKEIMERLYAADPENQEVIGGLVDIARLTLNQDDVKKYSEALCRVDDSIRNNLVQIQVFLSVGLVSDAELKMQSFREKNPDEPLGQLLNAAILMRQGKLDEALKLTNRSLETDQANPLGWLLRGRIKLLLGDSTQAINDLTKAASLKDSADSRIALARAYMAADRMADAVMELSAIVDDPASPEQARLLLEAIYSKAGNFAALASFYGRMMKQYPDDLRWKMKAALLAMRAKNFAAAESIYKLVWNTSLERGEPDPGALEGYIRALISGEKLQESMDVSSKYVNTEFKTVALVGMALTKWEMKDRPAAVEYFRMAADSVQDSPTTATDILNVMYNVIGPDEVEKYCQEKLAEDADSLVANYVLYHLSMITGDYNKAIAFLDKCIVISGSDSEYAINFMIKKGDLLARAYKKYSDKRHLDEAVTTWKYVLEKFPKNTRLLNNIAYLLAEDGRELDLASEYAKRAVEASPDNPDSLDTYAYVLYKNNRFEEAAEQAHASLQQYEALQAYATAEVYQHLGMIMEELGKKNEAIEAYEKALELGDNSGEKELLGISQEGIEQINEALRRLSN